MTASAESLPRARGPAFAKGRYFVGPLFDWMLIGGGLSLVVVTGLYASGYLGRGLLNQEFMLSVLLFVNSTHFASSTVRLYSKPGSFRDLPMMTMAFPIISVAVLTLALFYSDLIGTNLYKLYLTWSPYHYAAQTFGLASMYAARSGCKLESGERWLLWWTCMLPFLSTFFEQTQSGLGWFLQPSFFLAYPGLLPIRYQIVEVLQVLVFVVPVVLMLRVYQRVGVGLPGICLLMILTNGAWWVVFPYLDAIVWTTVFHGVQYLAIVMIFHLRDHPPKSAGRAPSWLLPTLKFYGMSALLAYALFEIWPYVYVLAGFSFSESALLCVAVINVHHFVVDRGIWKIRKDAGNRKAMAA